MEQQSKLSRRAVLGTALVAGLGGGRNVLSTAGAQTPTSPASIGGSLPARGNFVIRDAYVMTMDPTLGDIPDGDVHVDDGVIVAVGNKLDAPASTSIDGRATIVIPGFVETHWHMWNSLLRAMAGDRPALGYFPTVAALGKAFLPNDMYQGTRLAAAEAINGGMTTVHSWCHNLPNLEFAYEDIRALKESGIRARFSFGWIQGQKPESPARFADLETLKREWKSHDNGGLISLGFGWWGVIFRREGGVASDLYRRELETARSIGVPISVHANSGTPNQVAHYAKENMLGRDLQIVSPINTTDEEIESLAAAGSPVSFAPVVAMRIGRGVPQASRFLAAGLAVGIAVDDTVLGGNADMFAMMKLIRNADNALARSEFKMTARQVLELATITGARSMGIDDRVGSLKPGKRADLVMISTVDVNLGVFTDPANMVVDSAQPSNVDTVVVDGRILKREGKLVTIDKRQTLGEASAALAAVRKRANW